MAFRPKTKDRCGALKNVVVLAITRARENRESLDLCTTYTSTDSVAYVFSLDVVAHSSRRVQPPNGRDFYLPPAANREQFRSGDVSSMHRASFAAQQI